MNHRTFCWMLLATWLGIHSSGSLLPAAIPTTTNSLRIGTFDVDASPPIGSLMAYDPVRGVEVPLSCRGILLLGAGDPIVLCAIDWIGISNDGHRTFREKLAVAARTTPERVTVHTLHQHDAPRCDFSVETLLREAGLPGGEFDPVFARTVIHNAAAAVTQACDTARIIDEIGLGQGEVEQVASNRRILGPDGQVQYTRYTATRDPKIRDLPTGTIDPQLKMVAFFHQGQPVAALTYYATHPQSYYRTGLANPDFPGLARNARQQATGVPHIHFNGAGGNIGAGKWNDGSPENRQVLADRVAAGMQTAWENLKRSPITAAEVAWNSVPVVLPVATHLNEEQLMQKMSAESSTAGDRHAAALALTWLRRCRANDPIDIGCLTLGTARILHLPGELFVEYQLAAQKLRPDLFVAMAAYGEYAPGYIGTEIAYSQGGYETSDRASRVTSDAERVLMGAIEKLLNP